MNPIQLGELLVKLDEKLNGPDTTDRPTTGFWGMNLMTKLTLILILGGMFGIVYLKHKLL